MITHTGLIPGRWLRASYRQPALIAFTLVQPAIWLLLFGQLFQGVVKIPGFSDTSYIAFLTPGIVMMTALMTAGWSGTTFIADMERGVMDRTLTSPIRRAALVTAGLTHQALVTVVQSLIMFAAGLLAGARYPGGAAGLLVMLACAVLIATIFAGLSNAIALLVHQQEALIAVSQFLVLPLAFLSSIMIAPALMPDWVARVARFNPVDWAAVASREALKATPDWGLVTSRVALLTALALLMAWLAARAYRTHQRSL